MIWVMIAVNPNQYRWSSEQRTFPLTTVSSLLEFTSPQNAIGPNGGRMVIDFALLAIEGTITVATAALDGKDVPNIVSSLSVEQKDGVMRTAPITGRGHRVVSHLYGDTSRYPEHANLAVGAAQAVALRLPIYFAQPGAARPFDYSLGCEVIKRIQVTTSTLAGAVPAGGTSVLSAASLTAQIEFFGHEEKFLEHKAIRNYYLLDFTSTTQVQATLPGLLQELYLVSQGSPATGGGGLITGLQSVRIDSIQSLYPYTLASALARYRIERNRGNTGPTAVGSEWLADPVTEGRVFPVLTGALRPWDSYAPAGALKVDILPATASIQLLVGCAIPRSQQLWAMSNAAFGVDGRSSKVGTVDGNPVGLPDALLPYSPIRVPLRSPMRGYGA